MGDFIDADVMDEMPDVTAVVARPLPVPNAPYRPRKYQLEMLEASMKENIIVAMDTGSGKTHIAIMRIMAELQICATEQMVWFLAPTVALCMQQQEVIESQIPNVRSRVLTGKDDVDRWTKQSIWNNFLRGVRIVVSTHDVLCDALNHGFVQISQLALMVFDEAHHCRRRHPANKIMQYHYHPIRQRLGPEAVPRILGLTATPIVRFRKKELAAIEANMDAVCKTPSLHRDELLQCIHQPRLDLLTYTPDQSEHGIGSQLLLPLQRCIENYDIEEDPSVELLRENIDQDEHLEFVLRTGDTYCKAQLDRFFERCCHIYDELGGWATDYFIDASIDQLRSSIENDEAMPDLDRMERVYLLKMLAEVSMPDDAMGDFHVSEKLTKLLEYLDEQDNPDPSSIIFARRRVVVTVLTRILSIHPRTKEKFRCASYVGWSRSSNEVEILGDLLSEDMQLGTLAEFKSGRKNLIVATDVLEEGLDISSCSLVISFDKPSSLKSFIQRRGRARSENSAFAILSPMRDALSNVQEWQEVEKVMVDACKDKQLQESELESEKLRKGSAGPTFWAPQHRIVTAINACLSLDDAFKHLQHFFSCLSPDDRGRNFYPVSIYQHQDTRLFQATVTLHPTLDPLTRTVRGLTWWPTAKGAKKEVAFLAYKTLFEQGIVDDHLLPAATSTDTMGDDDNTGSSQEVEDIFRRLARCWSLTNMYFATTITFSLNGVVDDDLTTVMVLPRAMTMPKPFTLYWDIEQQYVASFSAPTRIKGVTKDHIYWMRKASAIFDRGSRSRSSARLAPEDPVAPFVPNIPLDALEGWVRDHEAEPESVIELYRKDPNSLPTGVIRDKSAYAEPRRAIKWVVDEQKRDVYLYCETFAKRVNILKKESLYQDQERAHKPKEKRYEHLPASSCTAERLSAKSAVIGRFIAPILFEFERTAIAYEWLHGTSLFRRQLNFSDNVTPVITALTTPRTLLKPDYEMYEFFGDGVLKFVASCQAYFDHLSFPEGRLSKQRDKNINNRYLAAKATDKFIDRHVFNDRFVPTDWKMPSISGKIAQGRRYRDKDSRLSTKTLADVVEAFFWAAYVDGGIQKASICINLFIKEFDYNALTETVAMLATVSGPTGHLQSTNMQILSNLLGSYRFNNWTLLEQALTPSSVTSDIDRNYQRLEFLGDAVLDMLVISELDSLLSTKTDVRPGAVTLLKHAVVNGNLLGFLCMRHRAQADSIMPWGGASPTSSEPQPLYRFLRGLDDFMSKPNVEDCLQRYDQFNQAATDKLANGSEHPWVELQEIRPVDLLSDIVESVLGAIFVDSCFDLTPCRQFMEALGFWEILHRYIHQQVEVRNPRNIAAAIVKNQWEVDFDYRHKVVPPNRESWSVTVFVRHRISKQIVNMSTDESSDNKDAATLRALAIAIPELRKFEEQRALDEAGVEEDRRANKRQRVRDRRARNRSRKASLSQQPMGGQSESTGSTRTTGDQAPVPDELSAGREAEKGPEQGGPSSTSPPPTSQKPITRSSGPSPTHLLGSNPPPPSPPGSSTSGGLPYGPSV
ncbi:hypothetical protein N7532_001091 [Penicillium argentinense]|uniref:Dicer-like protein 2 n=1 Tax=Penicillium argentinense TaxID=1131581 RepID=A0A9W9G221_9EURO|nr:uncharacterized protein N7532_001091 [Penicillium argentinense]KAJ5110556.1 hypothetical protein N7532_001091 [Penicillium argentinense]